MMVVRETLQTRYRMCKAAFSARMEEIAIIEDGRHHQTLHDKPSIMFSAHARIGTSGIQIAYNHQKMSDIQELWGHASHAFDGETRFRIFNEAADRFFQNYLKATPLPIDPIDDIYSQTPAFDRQEAITRLAAIVEIQDMLIRLNDGHQPAAPAARHWSEELDFNYFYGGITQHEDNFEESKQRYKDIRNEDCTLRLSGIYLDIAHALIHSVEYDIAAYIGTDDTDNSHIKDMQKKMEMASDCMDFAHRLEPYIAPEGTPIPDLPVKKYQRTNVIGIPLIPFKKPKF